MQRKYTSVLITCVLSWAYTYLSTEVFDQYATGLFIWLPVMIGALTTVLFGYKNVVTGHALRNASLLALLIYCLGLLVFAFEGLICIIMVAPVGILFTWIGYLLGIFILRKLFPGNNSIAIFLLVILSPAVMSVDAIRKEKPKLRSVTTSVEIAASPETVWQHVIAFPPLQPPAEFIFKTGIAYPVSATIEGSGVGAVRRCNFSTGSFVEPVTVWDPPHVLAFTVLEQPEPMKELSPYKIHPNHLEGYWISKHGEFKLTPMSNGHTLLTGTTWYENKIRPDIYWSLWSDKIVHAIHNRVLQHIKNICEQPA